MTWNVRSNLYSPDKQPVKARALRAKGYKDRSRPAVLVCAVGVENYFTFVCLGGSRFAASSRNKSEE